MEAIPALAGQSAGLIDEVKPARQIIEETVAQFFAITGRLGGLASRDPSAKSRCYSRPRTITDITRGLRTKV